MISEDNNCYTRLYKRKIENDFGAEFLNSLGVSDRLFPLVYICLKHRRIPPLKRKVFVASKIEKDLLKNNRWTLLKSRIESGEDINNYISKKTRNWYEYDFLLYSCNIYHIHLRSSIKGGGVMNLYMQFFKMSQFMLLIMADITIYSSLESLLKLAKMNGLECTLI